MKKTLLISCALLLTAVGASAQITDVTDDYIKNASFEDDDVSKLEVDGTRASGEEGAQTGAWTVSELTGWTLTNASNFDVVDLMTEDATATDNNLGVPGTAADGECMLYLKRTWASSLTAAVKQTITLPAGTYMLTVDSKCFSGGSSANLVAGSASNAITINGTSAGTTDSHPMTDLTEWTTNELTFTVTPEEGAEEAEVSIGVEFTLTNTSPGSFVLDNFKLYSIVIENDVTWKLANPSFEVDNVVADLTVDTSADSGTARHNDDNEGAWTVTSLTGWDLTDANVDACDLMTKDAAATDNNLGVPSAAADGTYWLYLKKSWGNDAGSASLKQTVKLPAGYYKLTVQSMAFAASATAKLVAGEASQSITINGTSGGSETSHPIAELTEWTTNDLVFTVEAEEGKEAEVELGIDFTFPTDASVGSILIDNFKLYSVAEITESITWEMTSAGWGTMILPFAADVPDGLTMYAGDALTIDESTIEVGDASESIVANTPYLVKGTEGSYSFSGTPTNEGEIHTTGVLTGTLVDLAVGKGAAFATDGTMYLLQNHEDEDVAFYPIIAATDTEDNSKDATLDAYHCYLTIAAEETEGAETAKLSIVLPGAGEETGIVAVEGAEAEANGAIYDLSGRRVAKAVKGVYIQNGKKVLVK